MTSTSNATINTRYHTSFRLATNSGYICRRSVSPGSIRSFSHFIITKAVGSNVFEINTRPFLSFHPIFNVDLLTPYFPPLLDTSKIAKQLTPTYFNPDYMEQASTDQIVDRQVKGTCQQRLQLYRVAKVVQLLHQGKWLTRGQIQHNFPHLMGDSMQWIPLLPKGGGLIQVDIGGHPPIPTSSSCPFVFSMSFYNSL
jgi:hypothetical protein